MDTPGRDTQLDSFIASVFDRGPKYAAETFSGDGRDDGPPRKAKRGRAKRKVAEGAKAEDAPDGSVPVVNPIIVTPKERMRAQSLLSKIGEKFAQNRKQSKSRAFEEYQQDLAKNSATLVMGGAVTLKELTVLLMDLEAYMKATTREGETAATRLQKYLCGDLAAEVE